MQCTKTSPVPLRCYLRSAYEILFPKPNSSTSQALRPRTLNPSSRLFARGTAPGLTWPSGPAARTRGMNMRNELLDARRVHLILEEHGAW